MAIFGRPEFLPQQQRDSIFELAGVRGFDGEFEKSIFIKGIEAKELAPNSGATLMLESARVDELTIMLVRKQLGLLRKSA